MIPSLNRQDAKAGDWPRGHREAIVGSASISYTCDCCLTRYYARNFMTGEEVHAGGEDAYWNPKFNPRLIEVGGVTYYGCSGECARILFSIHHQYAMREGTLGKGEPTLRPLT